ncbi:MAG: hypothetical protein Q7U04_16415 [Bacteriovorax sp.]|nr:hypothetical protein [Bacteriovorax sp.]
MRNIALWIIVFTTLQSPAWASYSTSFKLISGVFQYSSDELSGNSITMGSPSFGFLKSLNEKHQLGGSLEVFFSTTSQSVSLYGFGFVYQYSLIGQGASTATESPDVNISTTTKWNLYLLSTFKRYSYFLGSNKSDETRFDQTGDFFNFDFGTGASYDIGNRLRATAEINTTLFSFASSDNRIKIKSMLVTFGIQKEF